MACLLWYQDGTCRMKVVQIFGDMEVGTFFAVTDFISGLAILMFISFGRN